MRELNRLKKEAHALGGEIVVLAGNHEDMAISFLMERPVAFFPSHANAHFTPEEITKKRDAIRNVTLNDQGLGIVEFIYEYL